MIFKNWPVFFLLALLPFFLRLWAKRNRPVKLRFAIPIDESQVDRLTLKSLLFLRYLALVLIVCALARPQVFSSFVPKKVSGIDIVLALDVSASMNAEDLADRSRLEVARDTIQKFIRARPNDRIGLLVFSGEALTLAPLTLDLGLLTQALNQAQIGILRDGTAIGDGLALGVTRLKDSEAKSRIIILLTDGENNVGRVEPLTAGELAAGYGIRVYTIAVGREGRIRIPIQQKDASGRVLQTVYQYQDNALNPELLKRISKQTQGQFYRVTDEDALKTVFQEIDQLEKSDVLAEQGPSAKDIFYYPLFLALLLLVLCEVAEWIFLAVL